jgi:hypothetical protein
MHMQKSLTVKGKSYTAQQITSLMHDDHMTNGGDYIVDLNGEKFFANYRHDEGDGYWAPVCTPERANSLKLEAERIVIRNARTFWLTLWR